jgi:hypothetical protein
MEKFFQGVLVGMCFIAMFHVATHSPKQNHTPF